MRSPTLLLFDPSENANQVVSQIDHLVSADQYRFELCTPDDGPARLQTLLTSKQAPTVAVIGPNSPRPLQLARQIRRAAPLLQIVFLADQERAAELRRKMSVTALIGTYWAITDLVAEELPRVLREAAHSTAQRLQLRSTLDRLNVQLSSRPSPDTLDYRRLLLSDRYLASILDQAEDAILSMDLEGRVLSWNRAAQRLFERNEEDVVGRRARALARGEWAAELPDALDAVRAGGIVVRRDLMLKQTETGRVDVEISLGPVRDESREMIAIAAIIRDITDRKALEQELQRSEREFSALVENSPDVIARLNLDLQYIYVSPGLEPATGVSPERFIGKTPREVPLKDYDWQSFEASCHEAITQKKTVSRAADYGGRNFWTRIIPELGLDGAVESLMMISQDVSDRVRVERELMQLTAQLFRIQDEERRRIARELHDETAQNLYGISVNLAKLNQLSWEASEAKQLIEECESLGNETLQEIRTLSYLLHPPLLDEAGLVSALQWYVQGFSKRSGIYVDVFAQPIGRLSPEIELALFRIVQESLTNVRRHSGSETASIRLEEKSGEIFLEIRDKGSGVGASQDASESNEHEEFIEMGVGIPGMQQRLRQLGGRLEIAWNDEGTTVTAIVPMTATATGIAHTSN